MKSGVRTAINQQMSNYNSYLQIQPSKSSNLDQRHRLSSLDMSFNEVFKKKTYVSTALNNKEADEQKRYQQEYNIDKVADQLGSSDSDELNSEELALEELDD